MCSYLPAVRRISELVSPGYYRGQALFYGLLGLCHFLYYLTQLIRFALVVVSGVRLATTPACMICLGLLFWAFFIASQYTAGIPTPQSETGTHKSPPGLEAFGPLAAWWCRCRAELAGTASERRGIS